MSREIPLPSQVDNTSVEQHTPRKKQRRESHGNEHTPDNLTCMTEEPLPKRSRTENPIDDTESPQPSTSSNTTEQAKLQSYVKTKKKTTAKQKERMRIKGQSAVKQAENVRKKIAAIQLNRDLGSCASETHVFQERLRDSTVSSTNTATHHLKKRTDTDHVTTADDPLNIIDCPSSLMLRDFEGNPNSALLLFHENGGLYRFQKFNSPLEQYDERLDQHETVANTIPQHFKDVINEIGDGISAAVKNNCINNFQDRVNYISTLLACGACGIRSFTTQEGRKIKLEDPLLQLLQLKPDDINQHDSLEDFKNVCSIYTDTDVASKRFFLHPELVETSEHGDCQVYLCDDCLRQLRSGKIPKYSIANGHDYGRMDRIPDLQPLTLVESYLVAQVRLYITEVKLLAPSSGTTRNIGSKCLKGHIISFPHDGPAAAAQRLQHPVVFPWTQDVLHMLAVKFVGNNQQFDHYLQRMFACPELRIRSSVVFKWLKFLKKCNPLYASIIIDESQAACARLEHLQEEILASATRLGDEATINIEKHIGSDIAGVHWHISDALDDNTETNADQDAILANVLVTDTEGVGWLPESDAIHKQVFNLIDDAINPRIVAAVTSRTPINEYIENDRLILGAFPQLFLLGRGVPTTPSSSVDLYSHYLHQYTGYMSASSQFIFLLSNQRRRHAATRSVTTRVKNTPKAFDKFHQIVNNVEFKNKIKRAVQDPLGKEALDIIRATEPFIQMVGKNVPYSPMERRDAMGSMCAIAQRYGTPSIFLTISPDDIHHPMILRLAFPSTSNHGFPAHCGSFLDALHRGEATYDEHAISEFSLQKLVTDNPCASAAIFKMVMENLFSILLGLPVASQVKKTTPLSNRREGVFGRATAAFSVTEIQGRGSLHAHLAIFGTALTPDLLQKASPHTSLVSHIAKVLDTMYSATIPKEKHLEGLLDRVEKIKKPRLIYEQSPLTNIQTEPQAVALQNTSFVDRVYRLIDFLQVHSHRQTCLQGKSGNDHCRMCKPSALEESTGPVQLKTNEHGEVVPCEIIDPFYQQRITDRDFSIDPLSLVDFRCIFWSLRRFLIDVSLDDPDLPQHDWPSEQLARFRLLSPIQKHQVLQALRKRNGSIVEVNDVITSLLASNTAAYFLGGAEQAKSILFYLIKYMTKDSVSLTNSITVINDAMNHVEKYPSVADNSGTPLRTTQHFLQSVINHLAGKIELSAPQAAAHLLDMPSSLNSTHHCFCFIRAAIFQVERRLQLSDVDQDNTYSDNQTDSDSEDSDDEIGNEDDEVNDPQSSTDVEQPSFINEEIEESTTLLKDFLSTSIEPRYGSAPIYMIDGVPVPVAQDTHYGYRGPPLQALSYYEYTAIVSIVKIPPSTPTSTGAGRKPNATFDFDSRHPLHKTHHQKLRSLQMTPILAGGPPPRYPGSKPLNPSRSWNKAAARYAMYIMTCFCPWKLDTLVPEGGTSWKDLGNFMKKLNGDGGVRPTTFLELCREKLITSVSRSLVINNRNKKMMVKWRSRAATALKGEPDWSGDFHLLLNAEQRLKDNTRTVDEQAARDIEELRAATNADDNAIQSQKIKDQVMKDHIERILSTIHGIFGSLQPKEQHGTQPNYVLTHVYYQILPTPTEEQVRDALKEKTTQDSIPHEEKDYHPSVPTLPLDLSHLNRLQQKLLDRMALYLQTLASGFDPEPQLLLLYGGPGVGKTHTIMALQQLAESLGNGVVVCTPTGAAATNIPRAQTIHSTFGFRVHPNDITSDQQLPPMPVMKLADAKLTFKNKNIFLIDEVSMLGPIGLAHISQRLQEITGRHDRPFGGLTVILSGDPYQLQPVASKSLYTAVVDQRDLVDQKSKRISPSTIGAHLFSKFRLYQLQEQMRTHDQSHIDLIDRLRNPAIQEPINSSVLQSLVDKQLTATDVHKDPEWSCTPIVVTLNEVRAHINYNMACRFAKQHNLPVIKWRLPITGARANALNAEETEELYNHEEALWGVFVAGAPGYLTYNINPSKGLANGTAIVYDSLSFRQPNDIEQLTTAKLQIAMAEPGNIVILDLIPHTINVFVPSANQQQWPVNQTLSAERVIIPVFPKSNTDLLRVRGCGRFTLQGNVMIRNHAVELGFSMTYEKVQGKTMNKIILDLNRSPTRPLQFPAVYTGITRVRKAVDLKILPVSPGNTLLHLKKLKHDQKLLCWLQGFDPLTGQWSRDRANNTRSTEHPKTTEKTTRTKTSKPKKRPTST